LVRRPTANFFSDRIRRSHHRAANRRQDDFSKSLLDFHNNPGTLAPPW
jgi:hypothetical protein